MAEDTREPDPGAPRNEVGDGAPDSTRQIPADGTRQMPADGTRQMPADGTRQMPADATGRIPADGTQVLPPVSSWSARAQVPPAAPVGAGPELSSWQEPASGGSSRWWAPLVLGLLALLLLAFLGFGLWMIVQSDEDREIPGTPSPSAPARPSATATPSPTPSPTPETVRVEVPELAGVQAEDARDQLAELGLRPQLRTVETDERIAGTVVRTEPGAGSLLAEGARIVVFVAQDPEPEPEPTGEPTPPSTGGPDADEPGDEPG